MIELNFRQVNLGVQHVTLPPAEPDGEPTHMRIIICQDPESGIVAQIPLPEEAWQALKGAMDGEVHIETATPADLARLQSALPPDSK